MMYLRTLAISLLFAGTLGALIFPHDTSAQYSCACHDSVTGKSVGTIYPSADGNCGAIAACNTSCRGTCALCMPQGGVDCSGGGSTGGGQLSIEGVITRIALVLNRIIPLLLLIGTALFLWGMLKYITAGGDEQKTKDARNLMVYGVIGLAMMVAVWGFAYLLIDFVFDNPDPAPSIPGPNIIKPL